uniref:Lysosomal-trafficking regulator-like n=1 Tax=Saccoglossus kowalevskii TaxID=10224 RepID=A0ABM0M5Y3_SACKO
HDFRLSDISSCFIPLRTNQCFQPPYSRKHTTSDGLILQSGKHHLRASKVQVKSTKRKASPSKTRTRYRAPLKVNRSSDSDENMATSLQQRKSQSFPLLTQLNPGKQAESLGNNACYAGMKNLASSQESSIYSRTVPTKPVITNGDKVDTNDTNPVDLCLLLLSLLEKLSSTEILHNVQRNSVAVSLIPQLARLSTVLNKFPGYNVESLMDTSPSDLEVEFADGWDDDTITVLQRVVLRLVLKLSAITCLHQNGCSELSMNGTLTSILDLATDINTKISSAISNKSSQEDILALTANKKNGGMDNVLELTEFDLLKKKDKSDSHSIDRRLYFVCEVLQGVLQLISSVMQNLPLNLTFMAQTLNLLHEFSSSQGYTLYTTAIEELENILSKTKNSDKEYYQIKDSISSLISNLTKVISAVKKAKVEYIHIMTCLKRKHRKCEFSRYVHHHHNVCGLSCSAYEETNHSLSDSLGSFDTPSFLTAASAAKCCVATSAEVLLKVFEKSSCKHTQAVILANLETTGVCCCMPPHTIVSSLLNGLDERPVTVRSGSLNLVNKIVLEQLGGGVSTPTMGNDTCNICCDSEPQINRSSFIDSSTELTVGSYPDNLDSAIGSDASTHDEEQQHTKWKVLSKYKELLLSENENVSVPVAKHLLHLVTNGNAIIKKVLFLQVFLPTFEAAKATTMVDSSLRNTPSKHLMSMTVLEHCFNALPPLLTSSSAQELFLTHGGLTQLLHLLHHDSTRLAVLSVFEVLIMAEDHLEDIARKSGFCTKKSLINNVEVSGGDNYSDSSSPIEDHHHFVVPPKSSMSSGISVGSFGVVDAFLEIILDVISEESGTGGNHDSLASEDGTDNEGSISSSTLTEFVNSSEGSLLSTLSTSERKISVQSLQGMYTSSELKLGEHNLQSQYNLSLERKISAHSQPIQVGDLSTVSSKTDSNNSSVPSFETASTESTRTLKSNSFRKNIISSLSDSEIEVAADVWRSCKYLYLQSLVFKNHFLEQHGADTVEGLLKDTVIALNEYIKTDERSEFSPVTKTLRKNSEVGADRLSHLFSLLECLLSICLECSATSKDQTHIPTVEAQLAAFKTPLLESGLMQSSRGQEFCDALLHIAIQTTGPLDGAHGSMTTQQAAANKLSVHFEPWTMDSNISDSSDSQSEPSDVCNTDGGYDADSERDLDDDNKGLSLNNLAEDTSSDNCNTQTILLHPQVCKLVLELLAATVSEGNSDVISYGLREMIMIAKTSQSHGIALYLDGLAKAILKSFGSVLKSSEEQFQEIHSLLLELFVILVRHSISSTELRTFLALLHSPGAPIDSLLSAMTDIASNMMIQPSYILCFPAIIASSPEMSHKSSPSKQDSDWSPWSLAPLILPVRDSLSWPPSTKGFSLSLWIRMEGNMSEEKMRKYDLPREESSDKIDMPQMDYATRRKKSPEKRIDLHACQHVCSVGTREMVYQMWYHPPTNDLLFRLVNESKENMNGLVLVEAVVSNMITPGKWHHLAMTYSECPDFKNTSGMTIIIVDGHHQRDIVMDYVTPEFSKQEYDVCCLLGHCNKDTDISPAALWQISCLMLFSDSILNKEYAYHLYTLGPDCSTLCKCDSSKQTGNYEMGICPDMIDAGLSQDMLTGDRETDIKPLRESIVLTYSPRNCKVFSLYQLPPHLHRSISISNIIPSSPKPSSSDIFVQQQAIPMQAVVRSDVELVPSMYRGLQNAVYEVGGISVFIFLFAKVVEKCRDEVTQSNALRLLLLLKSRSLDLAEEFQQLDGYGLIYKVLLSDRCHLGFHMLKVMLDACCHDNTVLKGFHNKGYQINHDTHAIIKDKQLVSDLLLSWRIWYNTDVDVWASLLDAFTTLLSDDHPYCDFNMKQLQCAKAVDKMLLTCKEIQSEGLTPPPISIAKCFVAIIQSMLGSPPDLDTIIAVCDFLLVVHPAVNTFVCHAPSSFYFTQHTGPQQEYKQRLIQSTTSSAVNSPGGSIADRHSPKDLSGSPFVTSTPIKAVNRLRHPSIPEECELRGSDPGMINPRDICMVTKSHSCPENNEARRKINWQTCDVVENNRDDMTDLYNDVSPSIKFYVGTEVSEGSGIDVGVGKIECADDKSMFKDSPLVSVELNIDEKFQQSCGITEVVPCCHGDKSDSETNGSSTLHGVSTGSTVKGDDTLVDGRGVSPSTMQCKFQLDVLVTFPSDENDPDSYLVLPEMETMSVSQLTDPDRLSVTQDSFFPLQEDGLDIMCTGLLKLLAGLVLTLPDNMVSKVIGHVILPFNLIVLSHHTSADIRTAIVKLLYSYFHRATEVQCNMFLKQKGFYLLANQLHQHGATRELVEACFTLTLGKQISLDEDIDPTLLQNASKFKQLSIIPVLSLVENCVHEPAVCHNTICLLIQLFDNIDGMAQVMLDNGLVEALCNVVSAINKVHRSDDPETDEEKKALLIGDIEHFLACIVVRSCSLGGIHLFQQFDDLITMIGILEDKEKEIHGISSEAGKYVRKIRWYVIKEALDHLQRLYKEESVTVPSLQAYDSYSVRKYYEFIKQEQYWRSSNQVHVEEVSTMGKFMKHPYRRIDRSFSAEGRFQSDENDERENDLTELGIPHGQLLMSEHRRYSLMSEPGAIRRKIQSSSKDRIPLSDTDIPRRFQKFFTLAVNLILYSEPLFVKKPSPVILDIFSELQSDVSSLDEERNFIEYLYDFLIECIATTQERTGGRGRKQWYHLLWASRDVLRVQLGKLLVYMLSPNQDIGLRMYTMTLAHRPRAHAIIKTALQTNLQHDQKVVLYLFDLISNHQSELSNEQCQEVETFRAVLEKCGFMPLQSKVFNEKFIHLKEDLKVFELEHEKNLASWKRQREIQERRQLHRLDGLAKEISNCAMEITQKVVMNQNVQRKKLLEKVRQSLAKTMDVRKGWHDIIQQLTHERAIWHDPEFECTSWQLDPTEGPARVRRRLQRCHLGLNRKYLMNERQRTYKDSCFQPLSYIFDDCSHCLDATDLICRTQTNEAIRNTAKCSNVTPSSETPGELLIGANNVYFVGDDIGMEFQSDQSLESDAEVVCLSWSYEDIKEIHKRWYQLRDHGLEIFLTNGKTFLLAFETTKERNLVCRQLMSMELPNLVELDGNTNAITNAWKNGQMTNFEYLMQLNKIAGRTFNDLMQYPVFPFILAEYSQQELDLNSAGTYRKLSKPIAVQYKDMEQWYVERYKWLKEEYDKPELSTGVDYMPRTQPHHYGSHYSNSGTVLQYLVRLPPFTKMFLHYQDQHFDLPDRTFHSIATAWRLSSFESTSDVKELIPEFFFLPEFLLNSERFNFGKKQSGEPVDNVVLPPWAKNDPRLFILIHRQALESDYVSQHIHGWIDLVFGYKQKGKQSVESINVFHPATYFGIDVSKIDDSVKRRAIETMIKTYGQTPKQLFTHAHPQRANYESYPDPDVDVPGIYSPSILSQMKSKKTTTAASLQRPVKYIKGLKWGNYVGSPTTAEPKVCWTQTYNTLVSRLVALPTGSVCGLASNVCLFVVYAKEKGVSSMHTTDVQWSARLSWGHPDGIMRLKHRRNDPTINFIHTNTSDQISCCSSLSDCRQLFAGTVSGVIMAYTTKYNPARQSDIEVVGSRTLLYGHRDIITGLAVCTPYSILVSSSQDASCIIWDLNRLCYVQSLRNHSGPVTTVAVSDTLGDIVSASTPSSGGSDLYLWSINGSKICEVHCDSVIHSLTFSTAPEGASINVVAAGLHTGVIKLWSSWDLKPVREIYTEDFNKPIISLVYSHDCNFLYAANTEKKVVAWNRQQHGKPKFIKFLE